MSKTVFPRDSVLVYIPLSVTADLGVAMRRVRAKRIAQIKDICPSLFQEDDRGNDKGSKEKGSTGDEKGSVTHDKIMDINGDGDDDSNESENENLNDRSTSAAGIRREQFGSIVEYLEAKYARGVMIDDLDERIRERKKQKRNKKKHSDTGGSDQDDDMSVLSDSAAGSCYSNESGNFIDDSELRNEVAHQILGSSAYGKTKIEARRAAAREKSGDDDNALMDDDDHGFFVNIGDLEMEDGWTEHDLDEDEDWMRTMAKAKGKKRKRSTNKDASTKDGENKEKKKVKKTTNSGEKSPNKSKKSTLEAKKTKKDKDKKKSDSSSSSIKAKNVNKVKGTKEPSSPKKGGEDKKKKSDKDSSPKKEPKEMDETKLKIDAAKKECANLKRKVTRLHKKCIEEIKKLTDEYLPRKSKKGAKSKVSIIVPEGKKTGDKISFNNPHDPSQKLQVLIPENCEAGETFKVSVPMPTVTKSSSNKENKFTKECINALDEYSQVFDDWCQAEANYRDLLPSKKKGSEFKVGTERLKKYDQMLEAFPKNLETPVDAPFLRKIVRRKRQNENKRLRLMEDSTVKSKGVIAKAEKKEKQEPILLTLNLPFKGNQFPNTEFKSSDFVK